MKLYGLRAIIITILILAFILGLHLLRDDAKFSDVIGTIFWAFIIVLILHFNSYNVFKLNHNHLTIYYLLNPFKRQRKLKLDCIKSIRITAPTNRGSAYFIFLMNDNTEIKVYLLVSRVEIKKMLKEIEPFNIDVEFLGLW